MASYIFIVLDERFVWHLENIIQLLDENVMAFGSYTLIGGPWYNEFCT